MVEHVSHGVDESGSGPKERNGRDVRAKSPAAEACPVADEAYRRLFESAGDAMLVLDFEGRFLDVNRAACDMYGFTRSEFLTDLRLQTLRPPQSGGAANLHIDRVRREGWCFTESVHIRGDGTHFPVEINARRIDYDGPAVLMGLRDLSPRRDAEDGEGLTARVLWAQEEARRRIGLDLHDGPCQTLHAVNMLLETEITILERDIPPARLEGLRRVVSVTQGAIGDMRRIMMHLRPSMLDELGLEAAVRWLYREYGSDNPGLRMELDLALGGGLGDLHKTVFYRVVQEGLANTCRHSRAKNVSISLRSLKNSIELIVRDDGCGFDVDNSRQKGVGLESMRQLLGLVHGRLVVESMPGEGTVIWASAPR